LRVRAPRIGERFTAASRRPWCAPVAAAVCGGLGEITAGPVAAVVVAGYAVAGLVLLRRQEDSRRHVRERVAAVDAVSTLAAELRAGVAASVALAAARAEVGVPPGSGAAPIVARLGSAVALAESSGAPLADVLDRLDLHLRAMDRARRTAEAQAAGARASAALLSVLPAAGIGLGYLVGVDPAQVLLHTPLGAGCLCCAVVLQIAGLRWSHRLSHLEVPA
jgi:tight adherence protein B